MAEIKWDIRRGAGIYRLVFDVRLKSWIATGKIKAGEALVWRGGFSGWRKPEELEELQPYFKRWERSQLRRIKRRRLLRHKTLPDKEIKNILIIDDEKDICSLLGDVLTNNGYNVTTANTKREGIACIKKQPPHLVFLDLKLPDGDGLKALSKIKKINPKTRINIISAYGSEEKREEAKQKGVYAFIDKPFTEEIILDSVKEASRELAGKNTKD